MAIYTKTGDAGTTALFDGTRVPKNSLRVDTYGTFDELNAQVSVCEKLVVSQDNKHVLHTLQHQLFRLCAEVATPHVCLLYTSLLPYRRGNSYILEITLYRDY